MLKSSSNIKDGMKLKKDIFSKLGGLLYKKGTELKITDQEILEAFGVHWVEVEKDINPEKEKDDKVINGKNKDNDSVLISNTLKTIDQMINIAQSNAQIPLLDLRKTLYPIIDEKYHNISFIYNLRYKEKDVIRYESKHAFAVGIISNMIAKWYGLNSGECMQIALAGILHDIGMGRISEGIVNKKGPMTKAERVEIKKHTLYSYQLLKDTKGLNEGAMMSILQHHEKIDGSGYPLQIKGEKIHLYSKIVAIADIFHAMISKRSYRGEYSLFQTMDELKNNYAGKLDTEIVYLFINKLIELSIGEKVLLSNGKRGEIIFFEQNNTLKPLVKTSDTIIDLGKEKDIYIQDLFEK